MSFSDLIPLAEAGFEIWLAALAVLVLWGLVTHAERLRGLLATEAGGGLEPERLQGLLVFIFGAGSYVLASAKALGSPLPLHELPDVSQTMLTVLTGSQVLYLGGKIGRTLT